MIETAERGSIVRFIQSDPLGGEQTTELELHLFHVLVKQARSLEELRVLWFSFCQRSSADSARKRNRKAAGA